MNRNANLNGAVWMIAAMGAFAIEDTLVKAVSIALPVAQVLIIFGLGGALLFASVAVYNKERLYSSDVISSPMRIRIVFEITGRLFYVVAISLIPLSTATVILQATPLVVIAGAALIFKERVGWRRWTAILTGLLGVLLILQPGTEQFNALSVLAVVGMIGFAGRDLASRAAPASLSATILGMYGFLSIVIAGALLTVWQQTEFLPINQSQSLYLSGAVITGVLAYFCLMKAMRTGEVSAVTPFRYTRLIFGIALGMLFFAEQPSVPMIMGSGLIVFSGLFILWRAKQIAPVNSVFHAKTETYPD